ncbi:hypothetical protein AeRB84_007393, partial [Aphanomyces euteiches]
MPIEYFSYFTEDHRETLAGLRELTGDEDLAVMLSNRDEKHLLHLVEVIGRYAANARLEKRDDIALLHEESSRALKNQILDLEGQLLSLMASKASQEEALRQTRGKCAAYQARAEFAQLRSREDGSFDDDDTRHDHESKGVKLDVSKFSGQEPDHVMRWLLQVTIAADTLCIRKESIKVAFAMSHLKGRAEASYSLRMGNPNCFPTLEDFASQLKKAFLPPNSDFRNRSRFLNAAQGKQTIREFVHELRYLYASMNDERSLPESTRVTVFMNGLNKGPARTELFRRYPETFDEAVSIALSEDFSQNVARASASDSMDMDISSMGQIPQRYQAGQPSPDKRCYECKQPGHFARNCPQRSDSRRRDMSPRRSQSRADSSSFPGRGQSER